MKLIPLKRSPLMIMLPNVKWPNSKTTIIIVINIYSKSIIFLIFLSESEESVVDFDELLVLSRREVMPSSVRIIDDSHVSMLMHALVNITWVVLDLFTLYPTGLVWTARVFARMHRA